MNVIFLFLLKWPSFSTEKIALKFRLTKLTLNQNYASQNNTWWKFIEHKPNNLIFHKINKGRNRKMESLLEEAEILSNHVLKSRKNSTRIRIKSIGKSWKEFSKPQLFSFFYNGNQINFLKYNKVRAWSYSFYRYEASLSSPPNLTV